MTEGHAQCLGSASQEELTTTEGVFEVMNGVIMCSYRKGILQLWYGCNNETIKM
jgi:hypothetical protein